MKLGLLQCQLLDFCVGDLASCWIVLAVKPRPDTKSRCILRTANEIYYRGVAYKRAASPVLGDMAEEAMLDLVPLTCAWWKVADADMQAGFVGEPLHLKLPCTGPVAVAAPASAVISNSVACG